MEEAGSLKEGRGEGWRGGGVAERWGGREGERERPQSYAETETQRGEKKGGGGGGGGTERHKDWAAGQGWVAKKETPVFIQDKDALVGAMAKLGRSATKGDSASREGQAGSLASSLDLVSDVLNLILNLLSLLGLEDTGWAGGPVRTDLDQGAGPRGNTLSWAACFLEAGWGEALQKVSSNSKFMRCLRSPSLIESSLYQSQSPGASEGKNVGPCPEQDLETAWFKDKGPEESKTGQRWTPGRSLGQPAPLPGSQSYSNTGSDSSARLPGFRV